MHALDRRTGKPVWAYDTGHDGPRAEFHGEAIVTEKRVIVPSDAEPSAHVYAFDAADGEVAWRMKFEGGVGTTPLLIRDRAVIVASATGRVARIDLQSGKAAWSVAPDGARPPMPRIPGPAAAADRVYFASNDPKLFALDAANGRTVWTKALPARVNTSLALHGNALYAGAADGHLHVYDRASGELRLRVPLGGQPYGTLVLAPPLLITLVNAKSPKLVVLDLTTNEIRWERPAKREWSTMKPLVHGGTVIAGTDAKDLCAFALGDGAVRWCMPVPQVPRGLGVSGGMLYVGTLNGKVLAYRLAE